MNDITAAIIDDELPAARLLFSMVNSIRPEWHTYRAWQHKRSLPVARPLGRPSRYNVSRHTTL